MAEKIWQFELEEYTRQKEPEKARKSEIWQTAIGLQAVDSLKTSDLLLDTAIEHIEGNITIDEAQERILDFYSQKADLTKSETRTKEADIVSTRIAKLLSEPSFEFSPSALTSIHRSLFDGVYKNAGRYRQYNISKKEWVLKGGSVRYADFDSIEYTIDRLFAAEERFSYEGKSKEETAKHLAKFISDIWQTHPFFEGNTRAAAVFLIKYMKTLGIKAKYDVFREYSWFFRNALVRANYKDTEKNIRPTMIFLEQFFENLLLGKNNKLKNRYMHVDYSENGADPTGAKNKFDSLDCSSTELELLKTIVKDPKISKRKISEEMGRSSKTVRRSIRSLKKKKYIVRKKGIFGKWKTNI